MNPIHAETYTIGKPYVTKNLEVNSCHIRKEDNDILTDRKDDCPVTYYSYDYGYFIFVPDENIGTEIKTAASRMSSWISCWWPHWCNHLHSTLITRRLSWLSC